jgi:hypothetical protein
MEFFFLSSSFFFPSDVAVAIDAVQLQKTPVAPRLRSAARVPLEMSKYLSGWGLHFLHNSR